MTSIEQHKLIAELRDEEGRMTREDAERFAMFRKRDKDDEDLDALSRKELLAMHERYVVRRKARGNPLDNLFGP